MNVTHTDPLLLLGIAYLFLLVAQCGALAVVARHFRRLRDAPASELGRARLAAVFWVGLPACVAGGLTLIYTLHNKHAH